MTRCIVKPDLLLIDESVTILCRKLGPDNAMRFIDLIKTNRWANDNPYHIDPALLEYHPPKKKRKRGRRKPPVEITL
jgi:hypothetical protein